MSTRRSRGPAGPTALAVSAALALCAPAAGGAAAPPVTKHKTTSTGFVRDWLRLGPIVYGKEAGDPMQGRPINYDKLRKAGLTDPTWKDYLGGEWKAAPSPGDRAAGQTWRAFHARGDRIDLDPGGKADYCLDYLVAYVWCPRAVVGGAIYVATDDFAQLYVNGRCVYVYKNERRGLLPCDEVAGVSFRKGWNVLQLKVVDVTHGYEMFLCLVDETGTPMGGWPISLAAPEGIDLADERAALLSKRQAHEAGQEKVPPAKAYFDAAKAAGADYPLEVRFEHAAKTAGFFKDAPVGYAVAGRDRPIAVALTTRSTAAASAKRLRVRAELVRRDRRGPTAGESGGLLGDAEVLARSESVLDHARSSHRLAFTVPTDEIGYYAVEASIYDGDRRVKFADCPFAIVSPPDYAGERFTAPARLSADAWRPGDWRRWRAVVVNKRVSRKVKFWPHVAYPSEEIAAPVRPNLLELPRSAHAGLGHITPTPGRAPRSVTTVRQDWSGTHRRYAFDAGGSPWAMEYRTSRASLAAWARTEYSSMTILADLDAVGLGGASHVAYRSGGEVTVRPLCQPTDELAPKMDAAWLLFWFAGSRNWRSLDIPVLAVLQHKPRRLAAGPAGVTLDFAGPAGAVAVMPLLGTRRVGVAETARWLAGVPKEIAAECDFWAGALRNYPAAAKDAFRLQGGDVQCRVDYEFAATKDDWGTRGVRFAPAPYWAALAAEHPAAVIELPGKVRRTRQLHPMGPVAGQVGAETARYTLRDMTKYVGEVRVVTGVRKGGTLARAYEDLAFICGPKRDWALSTMSQLGGARSKQTSFTLHRVLLARDGAFRFGQHCFENECSMIANTAGALPYLPAERRTVLKALMMRFMENGTVEPRYRAFNDKRLMYEDVQWFISRFLCGMWQYAHSTGHWQLVRHRWPLLRAQFGSIVKEMTFENLRSCGSEESNLLYQAAIGYARCAKVADDPQEYRYATYCAARHLALQQALWQSLDPNAHQARSWYAWTPQTVGIADAAARCKRPALFYWWMMSNPIYDPRDERAGWHATVISPFSYPYMPEIARFHTERNRPLVDYYLAMWRKHWPKWYKGKTGGWGVYFGAPEMFASRGWMCDYTGESAEEMMEKYLQNHWGTTGPEKGRYEFNNRGWMSLPKALTAIIEASGKRRWVRHY